MRPLLASLLLRRTGARPPCFLWWGPAVLVLLGFVPYVLHRADSRLSAQAVDRVDLPGVRTVVTALGLAAGAAAWNGGIVLVAILAWRSGGRHGRTLLLGAGIEFVVVLAKAIFIAPWIAVHLLPSGAYIAVPDGAVGSGGGSPPLVRYDIDFPSPGVYAVRLRMSADDWDSETVNLGLDGEGQPEAIAVSVKADGWWRWTSRRSNGAAALLRVPTPGPHVVDLWGREDGARVDRLEFSLIGRGPVPEGAADPTDAPFEPNRAGVIAVEAEAFDGSDPGSGASWRRGAGPPRRWLLKVAAGVLRADMPSAHVARVVVGLGLVVTYVPGDRRPLLRRAAIAAAIVAATAVACARMLTEAHSVLGVTGGAVVGWWWLQWVRRRIRPNLATSPWLSRT